MKFGEIMRKSGKGKGRWPCCRTGPQAAGWGCQGAVPSLGSKPAQTSGGPAAHRGPREAGLGLVGGAEASGLSWRGVESPGSPVQPSKPSRTSSCTGPATEVVGATPWGCRGPLLRVPIAWENGGPLPNTPESVPACAWGPLGVRGVPPRPLSHHTPDTGPLLLKPRRPATLRGALLKGLEVWLRIGAPGSGSPPPGRGAQRPCALAQRSRKAASWAGRSSGHGAGVVPRPPPSTGSRGHWLWCLRKRNKQTFNLEKPRTEPDLCAEPSGSE